MESPLVSVITPFHNTAEHLHECVESVLAQTHANLELILQDNASSDGSTDIAIGFSRQDPRVKYVRLDPLLPQVPNYNLALTRIASASAYCKIVQADDWITRDCIREMVDLAEHAPRVGLVSAYRLKGGAVLGDGLDYSRTVTSGLEAARLHLLTPSFLFGSPTTVMYRSEVVRARQPFFAEGRLHEDTEACFEILRDWDFGFVHQILSCTRVDADSISGQQQDKDPGILDSLITLRRYGPDFLSADEFQSRLREVERRYYRRLAHAAFCARESAYWDLHKRGLRSQPPGVELGKLMRAMGVECLSLLTCPREAIEILRSWARALAR
jgi:glycosyltransferase involved in cell wall biosynthesis